MRKSKRNYKSEILDIVKTKDWDKARQCNDINLYQYIKYHKDTDENCKIIWEHIKIEIRDFESEISEIIETKDWDKAKKSNDINLYQYICYHKDTDENCKIIWEHIKTKTRDFESEILEIIRTKDWDRTRYSNDINLYQYILRNKDTDENCKIIWEHVSNHHHNSYTIKEYLQYYFKYGKPKYNSSFRVWFNKGIRKGNQCCIDIKNLIVAADIYKDPVAIETLDLIKNHLEKEDT